MAPAVVEDLVAETLVAPTSRPLSQSPLRLPLGRVGLNSGHGGGPRRDDCRVRR